MPPPVSFTFKSRHTLRITSECFGQELDRNTATQFRIGNLIHFAHSTGAQVGCDFEMSYCGTDHIYFFTGTRRGSSSKKFWMRTTLSSLVSDWPSTSFMTANCR